MNKYAVALIYVGAGIVIYKYGHYRGRYSMAAFAAENYSKVLSDESLYYLALKDE